MGAELPMLGTHLQTSRPYDFRARLESTLDDLISFSHTYKNYCVAIVDIVGSTRVTASLSKEKACKYYGIFLNSMAAIAKEFGAVIVKNIGDSLLYYFPKTSDINDKLSFSNSLECGFAMIDFHPLIDGKMNKEGLPPINYRISTDYGSIMIAKSANSLIEDVFGPSVNICTKINRLALPNSMVIGGDLYQIAKSFNGYHFKPIMSYQLGLKLQYPVYSIMR